GYPKSRGGDLSGVGSIRRSGFSLTRWGWDVRLKPDLREPLVCRRLSGSVVGWSGRIGLFWGQLRRGRSGEVTGRRGLGWWTRSCVLTQGRDRRQSEGEGDSCTL